MSIKTKSVRNVGPQAVHGASISARRRFDVRSIREALGLPRKDFARFAGFSERTIAAWESGKPPTYAKMQHLIQIERLQLALARVIRSDYLGVWLRTPNEAFSGLKPLEMIERGEVDRLWRMIYELESGVPT